MNLRGIVGDSSTPIQSKNFSLEDFLYNSSDKPYLNKNRICNPMKIVLEDDIDYCESNKEDMNVEGYLKSDYDEDGLYERDYSRCNVKEEITPFNSEKGAFKNCELDEELEEVMQKTKRREQEIRYEIASFKIQGAYRRFILRKKLTESYSPKRSINKSKTEKNIIAKYANHCARLIQRQYRKYKRFTMTKSSTLSLEESYCKEHMGVRKNADERPIKFSGRTYYDIEVAMNIETPVQNDSPLRPIKKDFLRKKTNVNIKKAQTSNIKSPSINKKKPIITSPTITASKKLQTSLASKGSSKTLTTGLSLRKVLGKVGVPSKAIKGKPNNKQVDISYNGSKTTRVQGNKTFNITTIKSTDTRKITQKTTSTQQPGLRDKNSNELLKLYKEYHKDNQSIECYFDRESNGSMIPILRIKSLFFRKYSDKDYEVNTL